MDLNQFVDRLLERFSGPISQQVFIRIQSDPVLMREYFALVKAHGVSEVNGFIADRIRENLESQAA
ncbi:hypothetical protein VCB98_01360 [Gammaproteobacteria bacterium AB-CW1]|uniref:Uncharacterized protein n=1 Tax=Natronospira elongata TaxID=3110268 RepID=A0AAP6JCN7_9GAMM|nr:hypothetical protein [Gammaproteobacteria bacterium AB-CW1]